MKALNTKPLLLATGIILTLTACTSADQSRIVKDITDSTIGTIFKSDAPQDAGVRSTGSSKYGYSIASTKVYSPDFGKVSITTVNNPTGVTEVSYGAVTHLDSGAKLNGKAYLYPISDAGFIIDEPVTMFRNDHYVLNSGRYYVKVEGPNKSAATGHVNIQRGVNNQLNIALE